MTVQIASGSLARGARIQVRVLGALIIRELQSRFGRENIGYLWFILEPIMLAIGVTVIQALAHVTLPEGIEPMPFHVIGYICYMMFRSNATRASSTVLSNRVLMYHRQVTLFDLILARTILELIATFCALILLLAAAVWLGFAQMPARPLLMVVGMLTMFWFTTGIGMVICAAAQFSSAVDRLVQPMTYLALPFSGMFFRTEWLPEPARDVMRWVPMPQIIDIVRVGMFDGLSTDYIYPYYLLAWCAGLTLLGLLGLKVARGRIEFE